MRRRYVLCGLSRRGLTTYAGPMIGISGDGTGEDYSATAQLVAVVDPDRDRVRQFNERVLPAGHPPVAWYRPDEFAAMVEQTQPDAVIVASPDHTHADHIVAGLRHGLDVITEKPMVTTVADAQRVLTAERTSAGSVVVTHNLRYPLRHQQIKRLIRDGAVGTPTYVLLEYHVDIRHGASYFLRWNRRREFSGGLSVHKSTHHVDLVSWWLDDAPVRVYAVGGRHYYGPDSPHRPRAAGGVPYVGDQLRRRDPYAQAQAGIFADAAATGAARTDDFGLPYTYQYPPERDLSPYDDEIDVEDTYTALISYAGGATLVYTIDFSSPWEGYRLVINGTHGQVETTAGRFPDGTPLPDTQQIVHRPLFGAARTIPVPVPPGGHDGADPQLRHDLFVGPSAASAELGLIATAQQGADAVAAGEAIWRSIAEQRVVELAP